MGLPQLILYLMVKDWMFSPLLFDNVLEILARTILPKKEIRCIQIGQEEVKPSSLAYDLLGIQKTLRNLLQISIRTDNSV